MRENCGEILPVFVVIFWLLEGEVFCEEVDTFVREEGFSGAEDSWGIRCSREKVSLLCMLPSIADWHSFVIKVSCVFFTG